MTDLDKKTNYSSVSEVISNIDKDEEASETEIPLSKEFQENVVKYVKLDDLIRKKQTEMSELKEQKKPCEQYILQYLEKLGEDVIDVTDGKLKKNKQERKTTITPDIIKKVLGEKFTDPTIVEDIFKSMEDKRQSNIKVNITRTIKTDKKKKPKK